MGFRCSVLGHDFGETEIEYDREERGSEVVTTLVEFQRCDRCGERAVISENTEITSTDPPATEEPSAEDASGTPTVGPSDGAPAPEGHPDSTVDDGEILEDESDERGHGEWPASPESPNDASSTARPWPDRGEDAPAEDAELEDGSPSLDDADGQPAAEAAGETDGTVPSPAAEAAEPTHQGERPEVTEPASAADGIIEASTESSDGAPRVEVDTGFVRAEEAPAPDSPAADGPTEYYCPNCDTTRLHGRTSLRVGDICPECRTGYLAERNP